MTKNRDGYGYSRDSVARALRHHETTGAITFLRVPAGGAADTKFAVTVQGALNVMSLTLGEAHALAIGLATGRYATRQQHLDDERKASIAQQTGAVT